MTVDVASLRSMTLKGPRVTLRGLAERDLPHTLAWRNDERSLRWFKSATLLEMTSHVAWFHRYLGDPSAGCMFFIEGADGGPIGQSSIYNIEGDSAEVGRFLSDPELRGAGLFREALLLTLHAAFAHGGLQQVHLEVIDTNERAIRLYESVGFERSGVKDGLLAMCLHSVRFAERDETPTYVITQTERA